jgi:hypothetical protein
MPAMPALEPPTMRERYRAQGVCHEQLVCARPAEWHTRPLPERS